MGASAGRRRLAQRHRDDGFFGLAQEALREWFNAVFTFARSSSSSATAIGPTPSPSVLVMVTVLPPGLTTSTTSRALTQRRTMRPIFGRDGDGARSLSSRHGYSDEGKSREVCEVVIRGRRYIASDRAGARGRMQPSRRRWRCPPRLGADDTSRERPRRRRLVCPLSVASACVAR